MHSRETIEKKTGVTQDGDQHIATRGEITRHHPAPPQEEDTKTLLIADDDSTILVMLTHLFAEEYQIMAATNGREALHLAVSREPDLILTDMEMPEMGGYELLAAIRQNEATRAIPVILMSGKNDTHYEKNALTMGFHDFIPKPFKLTNLTERVKRAFGLTQDV